MRKRKPEEINATIDHLVDQCRDRALWFLRPDFYPATDADRLRTLDYIAEKGDLATFQKTSELRRWLLQTSSEKSAG